MTHNIGKHQKLIGHPPSQARLDRDAACAAWAAMAGARPLRPPPTRFELRAETSAARALRADKRAGLL